MKLCQHFAFEDKMTVFPQITLMSRISSKSYKGLVVYHLDLQKLLDMPFVLLIQALTKLRSNKILRTKYNQKFQKIATNSIINEY